MKRILLPVILLLILASCQNYVSYKVTFTDPGNLEKGSDVFVNEEIAGKVIDVKKEDNKHVVTVGLANEYRNRITKGTAFYMSDRKKDTKIIIVPGSPDNEIIEEGTTFSGKTEFEYSLRKGVDNIKEDVKTFFESEDWKKFRDDFETDLNKALDKGDEQIKENLPVLKEKWEDFLQKMDEQFGDDMKEKVLPFIDSLGQKLKDLENKADEGE